MELKKIAFTSDTEKKGVNPVTRSLIKAQAVAALDLTAKGFIEGNDRKLYKAIAVDEGTEQIVYVGVEVTVGFADGSKVKTKSNKVVAATELPILF